MAAPIACRADPATSAEVVTQLAPGDAVEPSDIADGWMLVQPHGCFVPARLVGADFRLTAGGARPMLVAARGSGRTRASGGGRKRSSRSSGAVAIGVSQAVGTRFGSCAQARAAGAAPIRAGQPGYSRKLDRDGDGVACE